MNYTRRAFLRQAALLLASIGVSQTTMAAAAHRYSQSLAKPTARKLALLVGIDQYPGNVCDGTSSSSRKSLLSGCATDVRLQRELLIHRFGFNPDDVVTLVNEDATRQAIEESFLTHLVGQARSGDVVVFHFSGLGSKVRVIDPDEPDGEPRMSTSLVPVDGVLPTDDQPFLNDVTADSLSLLVRSLQTDQVITFLDTSYGAPQQWLDGYVRLRSRTTIPQGRLHPDELELQKQLLQKIRGSRESLKTSPVPGLLLRATDLSHGAVECLWDGFSAGLFTYALTQQLWWLDSEATSLSAGISLAGARAERVIGEPYQPVLSGTKSDKLAIKSHRFQPSQPMSADGAVTGQNNDIASAQVFLGGLPALVLANYGTASVFQLVQPNNLHRALSETPPVTMPLADAGEQSADPIELTQVEAPPVEPTQVEAPPVDSATSGSATSDKPILGAFLNRSTQLCFVQLRSHNGIYGQVRPINSQPTGIPIEVGQFVLEHIRVLSKNISLTVGLDAQLERIERVDATSAFSSISDLSTVVAGEQFSDVLFGKSSPPSSESEAMDDAPADSAESQPESRPTDNKGYGLFYLSRVPLPNMFDKGDEAVKTAVQRLEPKFRNLLAAKLLRLTDNQGSSQLGVRATLEMLVPQERILMQQTTFRAPWNPPESRLAQLLVNDGKAPSLATGSKIRYRVQNYGDRPVYCVVLGIDSDGNVFAVYPPTKASKGTNHGSAADESMILPGEMLTLPSSNTSAEWTVNGPGGLAETYVICSRAPLTRTAEEVSKATRPMGSFRQMSMLSDSLDPADVMHAMLADVSEASRREASETFDLASDSYALHMASYASLSFIYRVVP
ncbi:MAG: caspase family protein [Cyanobacteria bacterium P01_E01_bin.6]